MMATCSRTLSVLCLLLAQWIIFAVADLNNDTSPTHQFKSRPDIHAPIIDLMIHRPELISPGYLFLSPYRNLAAGPYIYDNQGELVWSAAGAGGPRTAHAPHVCQYKGRDHLCYFSGDQHHGYARGFGVIMDNAYRTVKIIESAGAGASADMHEFRLTPFSNSKTVLMTVYQPRPYDLMINARYNLQNGMGWVIDGVFQEVDIDTGEVVFEWRSLDHVDPSASWVMPGTTSTSGDGLDTFTGWDYFHINSVDKNKAGDYLVSSRHASTIYKISGKDGHIIWQLGGSSSDFQLEDLSFGYQHEVRWKSENTTHTILSFFDNSSNAYNYTSVFSRGLIVAIDHTSKIASVLRAWGAPEPSGGLLSGSQGSIQLLPDGGSLICWGEYARFSEHTASGDVVMYGSMAKRESNVMMYRAFKFDWQAQPITKPTIWTFSKSGDSTSGTRLYVSWNGATEVRSWRIHRGDTSTGDFIVAADRPKNGFETEIHLPDFHPWTYVDALDSAGRVLASSAKQLTFVPSPALAVFCDERDCKYNDAVGENDTVPYTAVVETDAQYLSTNRGYDTMQYYVDAGTASSILSAVQGSSHHLFTTILILAAFTTAAVLGTYYARKSSLLSFRDWYQTAQSRLSKRRYHDTDETGKEELEMLSSSSSEVL